MVALVIAAVLVLPFAAMASAPLIVDPAAPYQVAGPFFEILDDPLGTVTSEQVASGIFDERFVASDDPIPSFGFTNHAYWFRFTLVNPTDAPLKRLFVIACPWLDDGRLSVVAPDGAKKRFVFGDTYDFAVRPHDHRFHIVDLTLPQGASHALMRLQTREAMTVPASLWEPQAFWDFNSFEFFFYGVIYGVVAVMLFYNGFLYVSIRERDYLYYVAYLAAFLVMNTGYNGFLYQFLFDENPGAAHWTNSLGVYAYSLTGTLFAVRFLRSAEQNAKLHRGLLFFVGAVVFLCVATAPFGFHVNVKTGVPIITFYSVLMVAVGLYAYLRGNAAARFFLLGSTASLVGASITSSVVLGLVPYHFTTYHAIELGIVVDVIMLSLALADRYRLLREAKEAADVRARTLLSESKERLEAEVAARTADLATAKERAEEATKLKDKFVTLVSHDLRSPLGVIVNAFSMLDKNGAIPPDRRRRVIEIGGRSARGMLDLIERLLDIGRLRSGVINPEGRLVDLSALAAEVLEAHVLAAEEKGILLVDEILEGGYLFGDPSLLKEVLANLVGNAVKFCGDGDVVTLRPAPGGEGFEVADTGPGVEPSLVDNLFRSDIKTSSAGSVGEKGTGLGLPYCADIVAAHGGELILDTAPGEGVQFTVLLPETSGTVLVVDDQSVHRATIRALFKERFSGIGVVEAENGEEALARIAERRPSLVITDLVMPEMDGFDLLNTIRSIPGLADLPVIVATSSRESSALSDQSPVAIRKRVFELGADDFVSKPIDAEEFVPRIGRFIACKGAMSAK